VFAKNPVSESKISGEEIKNAIRLAMIAELDAINFYLQIANKVDDERVKKVFEDVAKEEAVHFGEFLELLRELDPSFEPLVEEGIKEVKELLNKKV